MKQRIVWMAVIASIAAFSAGFEHRAIAQESEGATAEATADNQQQDSAATESAQPADDAQSGQTTGQSSATATDDRQNTATDSSDLPAPSGQTQQSGTAQTQGSAQTPQEQGPRLDRADSDRTSADIEAQGRADTQGRADSQGRADAQGRFDERGRFDDRGRRDDRGRFDDRDRFDDRGRFDRDRRDRTDVRLGIHFGVASGRGLTINTIERGSVFFDSGLRRGDVLISIDGRAIRSEADFVRIISVHHGRRVPVVVLRDGREETVYITYHEDFVDNQQPYIERREFAAGSRPFLGLEFDGRIPNAAVVATVTPNSPAEQSGLQPGDEIFSLNGERVLSYRDAIDIIRSMQPGDRLAIDFSRRMEERTEAVLGGRPGQPMRTAERSIRMEREYVPAPRPVLRDPDIEVRRDYYRDDRFDRDDDFDRDRDDDRDSGRGILPWRRN